MTDLREIARQAREERDQALRPQFGSASELATIAEMAFTVVKPGRAFCVVELHPRLGGGRLQVPCEYLLCDVCDGAALDDCPGCHGSGRTILVTFDEPLRTQVLEFMQQQEQRDD